MRSALNISEVPRYPIIAGTCLLAILVSLFWWANNDISPLFESAMIRRGELWRLLTSIFPHVGVLHLIFNVYWLWVFGSLVEETYGHLRTVALIVLFAAIPNAFEFALLDGGVGLSGVGYGLFGLVWVLSRKDARFADAMDSKTVQLFVGWFFLCIVMTLTKIMEVANIAHGVGAVTGVLTGFAINLPQRRVQAAGAISVLLLAGLWGSTVGRPRVNLSKTAGSEEGHLGYAALLANNDKDAVRWFQDAVAYRSPDPLVWYDLGVAYERVGNHGGAATAYRTAAAQGDAAAQYVLGSLYLTGKDGFPKDYHAALDWCRKAAAQNDPDALNALAWEYATSSDPTVRDPKAALEYASRVADIEKDKPVPNHLDTLAEAYFVNGQYEQAIKNEQQAIALSKDENKGYFEASLKRYERALGDSVRGRPIAKNE